MLLTKWHDNTKPVTSFYPLFPVPDAMWSKIVKAPTGSNFKYFKNLPNHILLSQMMAINVSAACHNETSYSTAVGCWAWFSVTLTMKGLGPVIVTLPSLHSSYKTCAHTFSKRNQDAKIMYLAFNPNKAAPSADSYSQTAERHVWVLWEKTSQEFDIHLSHYNFLYPLSTLPFTDRALMLSLPPTCIWIACHGRKSKRGIKKNAVN